MVDHKVYATEMIGGLNDVVHIDTTVSDADRIRLEDIARLVMRQATALDMV